jgi:hypothetical protein
MVRHEITDDGSMEDLGVRKPKKVRVAREEYLNREGHWSRDFSARYEPWPIIEHWAHEYDYHLVAIRGPKRLYQKGDNESRFVRLVEIKQHERRVTMSAWVQVGFLGRLQNFFMVPRDMGLEPSGFWGVKSRRGMCNDLNSLLQRLNQPLILGSVGFHLSDMHPATLILAAAIVAAWVGFVVLGALKMEVRPGLTNQLLLVLGKPSGLLAAFGLVCFLIHGFVEHRYLSHTLGKAASAFGFGTLFVVSVLVFGTKTKTETVETKFSHYCVMRFEEDFCRAQLDKLTPDQRAKFRAQLQRLQTEITLRDR